MLINTSFLKQFNPCTGRWKNWLKHYKDWSGAFSEFLSLDKITKEDKLWVIGRRYKDLEKFQRLFAFSCASRAVDNCGVDEIQEYFNAIILIYETGELDLLSTEDFRAADRAAYWAADRAAYWAACWAASRAADRAAYWAACWAADRAAYWAAEEKDIQIKIGIQIAEELNV